jgi:hypothetical protein
MRSRSYETMAVLLSAVREREYFAELIVSILFFISSSERMAVLLIRLSLGMMSSMRSWVF